MTEPPAVTEVTGAGSWPAVAVGGLWVTLAVVAVGWGGALDLTWPAWSTAFWAAAVWGVNLLVLCYVVGPPFTISRIALLSVVFAFLMTVVGTGSYWATTQLFPQYRVQIERAGLFVALCTLCSLIGIAAGRRLTASRHVVSESFQWDWDRLRVLTFALAAVCALGTYMSLRRIGYLPILSGDPESLRVEFPAIAGIWFRLSVLGIVLGLIAGAQVCARRATGMVWLFGALGLIGASAYGNRFFLALPIGAIVLLWDQVRGRISLRAIGLGLLVGVPALAVLGWWRQQDASVVLLGPIGMVLFGTLGEFRDLGWTLDYYSSGAHPLLHGSTLGGLLVPLLPSPLWSAVGVDKAAIFAHSNAAVLAQEMGQFAAQRVGIYGELFMNFGWLGALIGAVLYGMAVGYLDRRFLEVRDGASVRGILLAVVAAAVIYAQVGQWNMLTSTITGSCYPILLLALVASHRAARTG